MDIEVTVTDSEIMELTPPNSMECILKEKGLKFEGVISPKPIGIISCVRDEKTKTYKYKQTIVEGN